MTRKSEKISSLIEPFAGRDLDAHYLGYFECFNRQQFFEAHEVLEELWLGQKAGPKGAFYKGLIQLAGAFVHLQKGRLQPAGALFKLAEANLKAYPPAYDGLGIAGVRRLIQDWVGMLKRTEFRVNPLGPDTLPRLQLEAEQRAAQGTVADGRRAPDF